MNNKKVTINEQDIKSVFYTEPKEALKDNLKICYYRITNQKMNIMDRIGFVYKGKHYVLIRDE